MHPQVKAALDAMRAGDRQRWFDLFAPDAALTDDGDPHDFREWSDGELFGKSKIYLKLIDRVEDNGLTVYGKLHSEQWGEFDTFMKFKVAGGKITRMDVGQIS